MSDEGPANKRARVQIGTHDGCFHADDVMAVALLRMLPEYEQAEVVRTRLLSELNRTNVVVDVGGVYDPEKLRFDHHQRSFKHTMNSLNPNKKWKVKLSSSGLVYYHFGRRVLARVTEADNLNEKQLEGLWDRVYEKIMLEIDAIDNGVDPCANDTQHVYKIHTGISNRILFMNPSWKEEQSYEKSLGRFMDATELARKEFLDTVERLMINWLPAYDVMSKLFEKRFEFDESGEILVLPPETPNVFAAELYELEREQGLVGVIKYYLYQDDVGGCYRVRSVNIEGTFQLRVKLPDPWCGERGDTLSKLVGAPDCEFVHDSGFIGGAATLESAMTMARLSLKIYAERKEKGLVEDPKVEPIIENLMACEVFTKKYKREDS